MVSTIGTAGMYVLDKGIIIYILDNGIILPGPEGMQLTGDHHIILNLAYHNSPGPLVSPIGNFTILKESPHVSLLYCKNIQKPVCNNHSKDNVTVASIDR